MQITRIEVQKKRKDRYNIYIDDEFRFGVDEGTLIDFDLRKDREISEEEIEKIENQEVVVAGFNSAMRSLKLRDRSEKEIRDKLKQKEFNQSVIEKVIDKLYRLEFLNDKRFAEMFVRDRMKLKPKGKRVLSLELLQKGVSKDTVEEVLQELVGEDEETELAKKVYAKAVKKYGSPEDSEAKQKIIKYMMSKGFSFDVIRELFKN